MLLYFGVSKGSDAHHAWKACLLADPAPHKSSECHQMGYIQLSSRGYFSKQRAIWPVFILYNYKCSSNQPALSGLAVGLDWFNEKLKLPLK